MPPPVTGILETALYVADLDAAARFYQDLFGFAPLLEDERMRALNVADRDVLLLFRRGGSVSPSEVPGGVIPPHDADGRVHFAFAIPRESLGLWEARLKERNVAVESRVHPERGGVCLYFRDPDGHLVELATPGVWAIY